MRKNGKKLTMRFKQKTLTDVLAKNIETPDSVPTPSVDLLMILMGVES
jgi:hypothetical protein